MSYIKLHSIDCSTWLSRQAGNPSNAARWKCTILMRQSVMPVRYSQICCADVTIRCPMEVNNTGQLTLVDVTANGSFPHLQTTCSTTTSLSPNGSIPCWLEATAVQDDFDNGTLVLAAFATAGHLGYANLPLDGTKSYSSSISLNKSASMDLVATVDAGAGVTAAGGCEPVPCCLQCFW